MSSDGAASLFLINYSAHCLLTLFPPLLMLQKLYAAKLTMVEARQVYYNN